MKTKKFIIIDYYCSRQEQYIHLTLFDENNDEKRHLIVYNERDPKTFNKLLDDQKDDNVIGNEIIVNIETYKSKDEEIPILTVKSY